MKPSKSRSRPRTAADPSARGRGGLGLDRLTLRLAAGITLLLIVPLGLGFYLLSRFHLEQTIEAHRRTSELQGRILQAALQHQMIDQDTALLTGMLREIRAQPGVKSAMVLDHEGEIRISSEPELVGTKLSRSSPACAVCHAKEPAGRELWAVLDLEGEEVLRSVLPIENRPECHRCHPPEQRMNGMLVMDTSLSDTRAELERNVLWFVGGTACLALLLLAGMGFLVRRLILVRLERLGRAARSIAAGNLGERAAVRGQDVIAALAGDFNDMAAAIGQLVREVKDQEAQLASILNSLDDGLVVLDREARIVASNRSFCRRAGTHPEGLRGRRCREGTLPCCVSTGECPAARCMASGEVQRAVFRARDENGGGSVEEVHASPVFDENGRVVKVVEIWRDISERVAEEERLAEIERLVSLGTLASGFSHEVNTPLASMLTCAESVQAMIDERTDPSEAAGLLSAIRERADTIKKQVLRCRRITEQFLRFSRGIPPSVEPIDLRSVVNGVVALVEPTARAARVSIAVEGGPALPAVRANAEVVQHVVLNLLVNAIQSCDGRGGRVVLSYEPGDEVRIRVRDDGCGIAPAGRAHLFEPFHSRKPGGTGLGLFLSRTFLRRFGGDVRLVESRVGGGSCFEMVFAHAEAAS